MFFPEVIKNTAQTLLKGELADAPHKMAKMMSNFVKTVTMKIKTLLKHCSKDEQCFSRLNIKHCSNPAHGWAKKNRNTDHCSYIYRYMSNVCSVLKYGGI